MKKKELDSPVKYKTILFINCYFSKIQGRLLKSHWCSIIVVLKFTVHAHFWAINQLQFYRKSRIP